MYNKYEIIDLSVPFYQGMPKYHAQWYPGYYYDEIKPENMSEANWKRRFTKINLFAHNGTHIEVSDHVYKDGNTLKNFGIQQFINYPHIIDLTEVPLEMEISKEVIERKIEKKEIKEGAIILLKTLYDDEHWGKEDFWDKSPYLSEEAAVYLQSLRPSLIGIDFQTEKPGEKNFIVHKSLLKGNAVLCEYLFHLDEIDESCLFMALPINFVDLEAAPVRASALRFQNKD